jgi:pyridoxamine 5'-phosphate oxidase family protein
VSFSQEEMAYLGSQPLARLATVSGESQPDVVPVGFEFDGDDFFVGGLDLLSTRKYRNVAAGNELVALVVDDLATMTPWAPRFVRVYGKASVVQRDGESAQTLKITPTVSWSWNLEGRGFPEAGDFPARKTVHRGED